MYDIWYTNINKSELVFEWDNEKEIINIRKHCISFTLAAIAYLDVNAVKHMI